MPEGNSRKTEGDKLLERIEKLEEEKAALAEDIKEVWLEAKLKGHDVKALRETHRLRKLKAKMGQDAYGEWRDAVDEYEGVFE